MKDWGDKVDRVLFPVVMWWARLMVVAMITATLVFVYAVALAVFR